MILPDNLHPLPVSEDEAKRSAATAGTDFVDERRVKHLLVGPLSVGPRPTCYTGRDGAFAGRVEPMDAAFVSLSSDEAYAEEPAKPFAAASRVEEPVVRLAAPPRPRRFGKPAEIDRMAKPWMISAAMMMLGLLTGAVLFTLLPGSQAPEPPAVEVPATPAEAEAPPLVSTEAGMP